MRYTMTFLADDYTKLTNHLFADPTIERGAYVIARPSQTEAEIRLLVRHILPITANDTISASPQHMEIRAHSFVRAMKLAAQDQGCFFFVHSHPTGLLAHSEQDNHEEVKLFESAYTRIHQGGPHGSIVFTSPETMTGRIWLEDQTTHPIERIRVLGNRFQFYMLNSDRQSLLPAFDRQVRAFGNSTQQILKQLTVGVVGAGGTGSSVIEQLIRLGVGTILVADDDVFDPTNINRVYGSEASDTGRPKVDIAKRQAERIGLETIFITVPKNITFWSTLQQFRECDIIFGCTDDQWGRSLLNTLAFYYCIPFFDMGVKIDSDQCLIQSIQGRVTTIFPSTACLICRGRITTDKIRAESLEAVNQEEAIRLREEGYAPEIDEPAPSVISFTTMVAACAIAEFLQRLTGYMGNDRKSSEVVLLLDETRIRTSARQASQECICSNSDKWGRGDTTPPLDMTWREE